MWMNPVPGAGNGKFVDELAHEQAVKLCTDPLNLAGDWPAEDSIDDFMEFIREAR